MDGRCSSKFLVYMILAALLLLYTEKAAAYPSPSSMTVNDCDVSAETRILCQRCAKVTKSRVVYPMCCNNTQKAKQWCFSYISYGKQHIQ